jgi:hypothetical protein
MTSRRTRDGLPWTTKELAILRRVVSLRASPQSAVRQLGRRVSAIRAMVGRLKLRWHEGVPKP